MTMDQVSFAETRLPPGSCIIHVYYTPAERVRFTSFLNDSPAAHHGAILACHREAYDGLRPGLRNVDFLGSEMVRIELASNLADNIGEITNSVRFSLRKHRLVRVMVDFGSVSAAESIFDSEAALAAGLHGLSAVTLSQYDGLGVSAEAVLEQRRTHAIAIIGNVFQIENADYTAPEKYFRQRAGGR
jgi:hypothetical protein